MEDRESETAKVLLFRARCSSIINGRAQSAITSICEMGFEALAAQEVLQKTERGSEVEGVSRVD